MSDNLTRARMFNTAVLATAYIDTDLDQALTIGLEAVDLAKTIQSARALNYVRDIRHRLYERYGDHSRVQQFTERISELLGAY
ncbi:MAG: hypothetical protein HYR62_01155 [Actinobacteria bacterium]|nr:hypothetical protein [Actinomycetota bacterium]MBI3688783.1 hypothetical protein [Actinomycetota bacterium]